MVLEFNKQPVGPQPWTVLDAITAVERTQQGIVAEAGAARLAISVLTPTLLRVRVAPTGTFVPHRSWAVTPDDATWPAVPFTMQETDAAVEIRTGTIRVRLERAGGRLTCYDPAGQPFAADAAPGVGWRRGCVAGWKELAADEHFYGLGERTGLLDKRGEVKTNWAVDAVGYTTLTDEMYQAIPFVLALRPGLGYGLFFNSTYWSRFDLGATDRAHWRMETAGPELDYYIIYGPTPAAIIEQYTALTGRMPLPPRWALGYHQCRWSYTPAEVVRALAREFRTRLIPLDVIHLDIDYMRGYRVFTWSESRFPDPAGLLQELRAQGIKTVAILDPGVKHDSNAGYPVFDEGMDAGYFVQDVEGQPVHGYVWPDRAVFPDFLRDDVRAWWGQWQHVLTEAGVAGIWNDMNEPALDDRPFGDDGRKITFPPDAPQGPPGEGGTHAETHNLYGLNMARASREGLDRLLPDERTFTLTRSGFAGIQRWAAMWGGDNHSTWDQLEQSLPMMCNMGLSGVAFCGSDIGGFAGNATPELFARWMQAGMLYPLMRGHSMAGSLPHEPWMFGPDVEAVCRTYIELRYQLLPYLYSLFHAAATTGAPILRPLVYAYPDDPEVVQLYDQVLLGPNLLAAPVVRPGVTRRLAYLPEGTWWNWWTGERHQGPTHLIAPAPFDIMPLYARGGGCIPLAPAMQWSDERPVDMLTLRCWPGSGTTTLYEDDGHTRAYQQGQWASTTITVQSDSSGTTVDIAARTGAYTPPARTVIVAVAGAPTQRFADDGSARQLHF